jgi:hypothetical protein
VAPSTIPPLTTYVAAGSMTGGVEPDRKRHVGWIRDRDDLPSDERSRLDLDQCGDGDGRWTEGRPAGGRIVPPMVAAGLGRAVSTRAMPSVGPPVMTGSPTAFSHVLDPSTIVAKSAYECVWSMVESSYRTEKSMGATVGRRSAVAR